jgi:hypothetical protein
MMKEKEECGVNGEAENWTFNKIVNKRREIETWCILLGVFHI